MNISSQDNINFQARLLSQWRCSTLTSKARNISIIELEKRDVEFAKKFIQHVKNVQADSKTAREIMDSSSKTILEILQDDDNYSKKIKIFVATYNETPCGIFIANMPKTSPNYDGIVYSSRHNLAKNETELDWLVTWSPKGNERLKGIGKALIGEYFRTVKKDKFRDVFVRAEVPEKSFAKSFYEKLGFEQIGNKRVRLLNKNSAKSIINDHTEANDETIPMIVTRSRIMQVAEELATKMNRKEFKSDSLDAKFLINI